MLSSTCLCCLNLDDAYVLRRYYFEDGVPSYGLGTRINKNEPNALYKYVLSLDACACDVFSDDADWIKLIKIEFIA